MRKCVNSAEKVARKDTPANRSSDEDSINLDIIEFMWNDRTLQERGAACDSVDQAILEMVESSKDPVKACEIAIKVILEILKQPQSYQLPDRVDSPEPYEKV